jgi:hypothetical protein
MCRHDGILLPPSVIMVHSLSHVQPEEGVAELAEANCAMKLKDDKN